MATNAELAISILFKENELLESLLTRNKSQHRRSDYFRNLNGAVAMIKVLKPDSLKQLLCSEEKKIKHFDNVLITIVISAQRIRRSCWALRQQIAAGYFMSFCVALLSISARLLILLHTLVKSLLLQRRRLSATACPIIENSQSLKSALEWLVIYGDGTSEKTWRNQEIDRTIGTHEDNDVGESVAFSISSSSSQPIGHISREILNTNKGIAAKLATDYSDSDSSVNEVEVGQDVVSIDWFVDTHREDIHNRTEASSVSEDNVDTKKMASSQILKASNYSDSEEENKEKDDDEMKALLSDEEEPLPQILKASNYSESEEEVEEKDEVEGEEKSILTPHQSVTKSEHRVSNTQTTPKISSLNSKKQKKQLNLMKSHNVSSNDSNRQNITIKRKSSFSLSSSSSANAPVVALLNNPKKPRKSKKKNKTSVAPVSDIDDIFNDL